MNNGTIDLDSLLGRFVAAHSGARLVTTCFQRAGRPDPTFKVVHQPLKTDRLAIHIAQREKIMRIDKSLFDIWARQCGVSCSDARRQMELKWSAVASRGLLGAGFFSTGRVPYVDIPLTTPELEGYLFDDGSSQQGGNLAAHQAPAAALKGNQARV